MTDADAAADAFAVLSDPARVAILRELASQFYSHDGAPVGFADLRRAVGVDDPGRFNYYLDQLRGRFVAKREDGYAPTVAGLKAVESAEAGVYTDDPGPVSAAIDDECPECGDPLTATYENHWVTVTCSDHGQFLKTLVPAALEATDDVEGVLRYAIGEMWRRIDRATDGVCPVCRGQTLTVDFREAEDVLAALSCESCYYDETNPVTLFAVSHPAVQSLYHEHGVDVRHDLPMAYLGDSKRDVRFVDADQSVVEVTLRTSGEEVALRVTDDLTVETA